MFFIKKNTRKQSKEEILIICAEIRAAIEKDDSRANGHGQMRYSDRVDSGIKYSISVDFDDMFAGLSEIMFGDSVKAIMQKAHITDKEFYKRSGIGRKIFWNIAHDPNYNPSIETAIACALGLHLDIYATDNLLQKAGYSLSDSILFDVAISYCIKHEVYNIMDVNSILAELGFDKMLRTE